VIKMLLLKIGLVLLTPALVVEGAVVGAVVEPLQVWKSTLKLERILKEDKKHMKAATDNLKKALEEFQPQPVKGEEI